MKQQPRYWFPAKRYGWGWGSPSTWEGWLVLIVSTALLPAGAIILPPDKTLLRFIAYCCVVSLATIGICWWKGEPPRWRWGERDRRGTDV